MWKLILALPILLFFRAPPPPSYQRVLCIGNSLTVAPPAPGIGWLGYHGMAASQPDRDYCHRVQLALAAEQGFAPELAIVSTDVNRWPINPTGRILFAATTAAEFGADLVVVQMGDNAGVDIPYERWLEVYREVEAWTPGARRIALGVWSPSKAQHEENIRRVAEATGMQYVRISDLHTPATKASQHSDPGVAWHPNDDGMSQIAERVVQALDGRWWLPVIRNGEPGGTIPPQ